MSCVLIAHDHAQGIEHNVVLKESSACNPVLYVFFFSFLTNIFLLLQSQTSVAQKVDQL